MVNSHDSLTLRIASLSGDIDAEAFLSILGNTIRALQEINKEVSLHGSASVAWRITALSMSSPATASIHGVGTSRNDSSYGRSSVKAFLSGLRRLERSDSAPPKFNENALRFAANVTQSFSRGIAKIDYLNNGTVVPATKVIAENANTAIRKIELDKARRSGNFVEFGEIEGRLKDVSELQDRDKIVIVDSLTGRKTPCFFRGPEVEQKVRDGWKHRVVVTGDITVNKATGEPQEMRIEDIRVLRSRDELPQIDDLLGFDITGGVDSVEYVRGLRDGE